MKTDPSDTDFTRTQIGISISDPINRRLVEGVAAQLGLLPLFLQEAELAIADRIAEVELLIADESELSVSGKLQVCQKIHGKASGLRW